MLENIIRFLTNIGKKEKNSSNSINTKDTAKERLHLVLMQDRANVSADFLELMKQEIIEVIKKYIEIDEKAIDVRLTNKENSDGTNGAPTLYANIPIVNIKDETRKLAKTNTEHKIQKDEEKIEQENNNKNNTENKKDEEQSKQKEISYINIIENEEKTNKEKIDEKIDNSKENNNEEVNNKKEKNVKANSKKTNKYNYKNKKNNNSQKQEYNKA